MALPPAHDEEKRRLLHKVCEALMKEHGVPAASPLNDPLEVLTCTLPSHNASCRDPLHPTLTRDGCKICRSRCLSPERCALPMEQRVD